MSVEHPWLHRSRDAPRIRHHQHERSALRPCNRQVLQPGQLCADARQQPELWAATAIA